MDIGDDESIMGVSQEDEFSFDFNDKDIPDSNTIKLLIKQLKLNLVELKVAQRLQNTNLLLHIDQLKKKYTALKAEVESLKAERNVARHDSCLQTDTITNTTHATQTMCDETITCPVAPVEIKHDNIEEENNSLESLRELPVERCNVENNTNISENDKCTSPTNKERIIPPSLPRIISVVSGSENIVHFKKTLNVTTVPLPQNEINTTNKTRCNNTDAVVYLRDKEINEMIVPSSASSSGDHNISNASNTNPNSQIVTNNSYTSSIDNNVSCANDEQIYEVADVEMNHIADDVNTSSDVLESVPDSQVLLEIQKFLNIHIGKNVQILNYNRIKHNEWIFVDDNTIIVCVNFHDRNKFTVSAVNIMRKDSTNKERYYAVVYKVIQKESEQNIADMPTRLSDEEPIPSTSGVTTSANKSNHSNGDTLVTDTQIYSHSVIVSDDPHEKIRANPNNNTSRKQLFSKTKNNHNVTSSSENQTHPSNNRDIVISTNKINIVNKIIDNRSKSVKSVNENLPLVNSNMSFLNRQVKHDSPKKSYSKSKSLITVEDRNKRKSFTRNIRLKEDKIATTPYYREKRTHDMLQSLMDKSCNVSPTKDAYITNYFRTEKKQSTNLPVTVRSYVSLDDDDEEPTQVLPLVQDDVVFVENDNRPIEID